MTALVGQTDSVRFVLFALIGVAGWLYFLRWCSAVYCQARAVRREDATPSNRVLLIGSLLLGWMTALTALG
jgi:hypothetical protein